MSACKVLFYFPGKQQLLFCYWTESFISHIAHPQKITISKWLSCISNWNASFCRFCSINKVNIKFPFPVKDIYWGPRASIRRLDVRANSEDNDIEQTSVVRNIDCIFTDKSNSYCRSIVVMCGRVLSKLQSLLRSSLSSTNSCYNNNCFLLFCVHRGSAKQENEIVSLSKSLTAIFSFRQAIVWKKVFKLHTITKEPSS